MMHTRVFIHGLESTSRGTKGVYFRERYPDMVIDDYAGPLAERMEKLTTRLLGKDRLIMVGSSYGGLMAAMFAGRHAERVERLVLLAPALNLAEFEPYLQCRLDMPTTIYHGSCDDVVSPAEVRKIAEKVFRRLTYCPVDDDHPLSRMFTRLPWTELLSANGC
ncbi:MAG: alpha/beta fold hydrolase [Syntrophales bacterium]|nr:alpha/beta fold hydrolase [Syntrophales bacterium]